MARMTIDQIDTIITEALNAKFIWNVDHVDVKDALAQIIDEARKVAQNVFLAVPERHDNYNEVMNELYYAHAYPATFGSMVKKVAKAVKKGVPAEYEGSLKAYQEYVTEYAPICEKFVSLKPFITKGRKPSTDPRKTPERTLDNTGTCAVCGMNVKLNEGRIVKHGYQVQWNQFVGECPGVGYDAFEISPKGAVAYKDNIVATRKGRIDALADLPNATEVFKRGVTRNEPGKMIPKSDPDFERVRGIVKANLESDIRHMTSIIYLFEGKIAAWKATALPDGNKAHMENQ